MVALPVLSRLIERPIHIFGCCQSQIPQSNTDVNIHSRLRLSTRRKHLTISGPDSHLRLTSAIIETQHAPTNVAVPRSWEHNETHSSPCQHSSEKATRLVGDGAHNSMPLRKASVYFHRYELALTRNAFSKLKQPLQCVLPSLKRIGVEAFSRRSYRFRTVARTAL